MLSINQLAFTQVEKLLKRSEYYGVDVKELPSGSKVIDTGLESPGGYEAGFIVTRVAMGGAGTANLGFARYDDLDLPTVSVSTDHPPIALFGAQLAGWKIKTEDYVADGSGPARALALKPKRVFRKIEYKDDSKVAVLLLETDKSPPDSAALYVAETCGVKPEDVYLLLTKPNSVSGMVQISGRVVETGLFRLDFLGLDPKKVKFGVGYAPIMPIHKDWGKAMGRAGDAITYGGVTSYIIEEEDEILRGIAEKSPSLNCKDYGKTTFEIFKEVNFDFTKVDPALFAPAVVNITSLETSETFTFGRVNSDVIKHSIESV
jgi:methenyltetrahydromethanopterin cyclohydrolase